MNFWATLKKAFYLMHMEFCNNIKPQKDKLLSQKKRYYDHLQFGMNVCNSLYQHVDLVNIAHLMSLSGHHDNALFE